MEFEQEQAAPRAYMSGPAKIRIVEQGPVRVAVEVSREGEGSDSQRRSGCRAATAGNRIEFSDAIDWRTLSANLQSGFPTLGDNQGGNL